MKSEKEVGMMGYAPQTASDDRVCKGRGAVQCTVYFCLADGDHGAPFVATADGPWGICLTSHS